MVKHALTSSLASGVGVTVEVPRRRQRKHESKQIFASRDGYTCHRLPTMVGSGRDRYKKDGGVTKVVVAD
jgi:hypothetical protein